MSEALFLSTIVGANAALLTFAAWVLGDERTEYRQRLATLGLSRERHGYSGSATRRLS